MSEEVPLLEEVEISDTPLTSSSRASPTRVHLHNASGQHNIRVGVPSRNPCGHGSVVAAPGVSSVTMPRFPVSVTGASAGEEEEPLVAPENSIRQNASSVLGEMQRLVPNINRQMITQHIMQAAGSNMPGPPQHAHSHAHHSHATSATPQGLVAPNIPPVPGPPGSSPTHSGTPDFVVDMNTGAGVLEHVSQDGQPDVNQNMNPGAGAPAAGRRPEGGLPNLQSVPGVRSVTKFLEGALPFIILMFAKNMYNHRTGILLFVALFGTFHYANNCLKRHISRRQDQLTWWESLHNLAWLLGFLVINIGFIYWAFAPQQLYSALYFKVPFIEEDRNYMAMNLWNLLWVVVLTDFVLKFATVAIKSMIAALPKQALVYRKKGKYYMLVEGLSVMYRSLVPVPCWVWFLLEDEFGGEWFSFVLVLLYFIFKSLHLWQKVKELKSVILKFRRDVSYGSVPSRESLKACDEDCAICQDKLAEPVMLSCKHIFCEDCVSLWFDRERTCPMCRANIVDNPKWRDGTTSNNIQLY